MAEEDCPCLHNEAAYKPGETIRVDCNTWWVEGRGGGRGGALGRRPGRAEDLGKLRAGRLRSGRCPAESRAG